MIILDNCGYLVKMILASLRMEWTKMLSVISTFGRVVKSRYGDISLRVFTGYANVRLRGH